jgi:dTDP-4-amino-4,6-dideoxygalactose transaminase
VEPILSDWRELIKSTNYTLGPVIDQFERCFESYTGAKHCIAVNTGTDALILGLKALGIGPGDEVITVTNTFFATAGAIAAVGADIVLVDSDDRFQINCQQVQQAITQKTKAIIPVHWGGYSPNIDSLLAMSHDYGVPLLEDACMAIGARIGSEHAGTHGEVSAFSMHPLKSLNAIGDGGMVTTNNDELASWMRQYRNHGMVDRDHIAFWGVNMRMQPLQAIVGLHGLNKLDEVLDQRHRNAQVYDAAFSKIPEITLPGRIQSHESTHALYMGLFEDRDSLQVHLENRGIETKIHYPVPLHQQEAAKRQCRFIASNMINSEKQAKQLLTLPVHQFLEECQLNYVVEQIKAFYD